MTENIRLCDTKKLLQEHKRLPNNIARKNRKVLAYILQSNRCEFSKYENRLSYMIANKVFALRCRNTTLIERN